MPRSPRHTHNLSRYLTAIAQPVRLNILVMLKEGELCVCDIYKKLAIAQNLTSHHLKVLTDLNLLASRKEGVKVLYTRNETVLAEYHALLGETLGKCTVPHVSVMRVATRAYCTDG